MAIIDVFSEVRKTHIAPNPTMQSKLAMLTDEGMELAKHEMAHRVGKTKGPERGSQIIL